MQDVAKKKKFLEEHGVAKDLLTDVSEKQLEIMIKDKKLRIADERLLELVDVNPLEEEDALSKLNEETGFTKTSLRKQLENFRQKASKGKQKELKIDQDQRDEVLSFLRHEDVLEVFKEDFSKMHIGDTELAQHHFLSGINLGLSGDAIHINASGSSGKGKSSLQKKVSQFFTKRGVLNNLSPKAIQYKGDIEGWIIVVDDVNLKDEDKITTLRSLTSNEEERALTNWTVIDQEFAELEIKGKCCIWLSNVDVASDPQLANRFQIDCVDESEEQDASVFKFRLKKFALKQHEKLIDSIFEKWKPITDLLLAEKDSVINPYFVFEDLIEWNNKADRRLFPQFATLVESITKAYKYQRERDKLGRLIATRQDFERALQIWDKIGEATTSKLSEASRRVYNALDPDKHKTVTAIAQEISKSTHAVRYNLKILTDIGVANSEQEELGRRTWVFWAPKKKLDSASIKFDWNAFSLEKLLQNDSLIAVIPNIKGLYASLCLPLKSMVRSEEMGQSIAKTTLPEALSSNVRYGKVVATDSENNLATSKHSEIGRVDKIEAIDSENKSTKDTTKNNNRDIGTMLDKITDRYSGYENTTRRRGKVKNDSSKDNLAIPYHDPTIDFGKVKSLYIDTTTTTLPQNKGDIQKKTYKTEGNLEIEEIIPSKSDTVEPKPKKSDKNVK